MNPNITTTRLYELKLTGMLEAYQRQLTSPTSVELSFDERLSMLVETEYDYRQNRALQRRIKNAGFRQRASIEDLNWHQPRGLKRELIAQLSTSEWIRYGHNCIITGPTGVGKSWLGCALGQKACRDGYNVRCIYAPKLFREMLANQAAGTTEKFLKALRKVQLLIIDDWGLEDVKRSQYRDLLELLDDRTGCSTMITSQYSPSKWHKTIGDPTIADAILDRLIHSAYRIEMTGDSMRKHNAPTLTKDTTKQA